jgi:hypothetical protein
LNNLYFLGIERDKSILEKYGLAFAYINHVEAIFEIFLSEKGHHGTDSIMLGKKIEVFENHRMTFKNEDLLKNIRELNKIRRILAHGISSSIDIKHKNKFHNIKIITENAIKIGKECCLQLLEEVPTFHITHQ